MKTSYQYDNSSKNPIKLWTQGVAVDEKALQQIREVANLPFIHKHVAVMPDAHWGKGATVGTVIATKSAIVPAAVGVDIGCGMCAYQTTLTASQLPDSLRAIREAIEQAVPHGRTDNGGKNDQGAWPSLALANEASWNKLNCGYKKIVDKHPKAQSYNTANHLGTLGTGNHFIEICLDEIDCVWIMLHSGSRGPGNRIGAYFIEKAKEEMERYFIGEHLPNQDLAYLVEKTEIFDDYIQALSWAQEFALCNRQSMMNAVICAMSRHLPPFQITEKAFDCHHNYVALENHFDANVWVTRKGAVRARENELGIIPGSMGASSFIVRGKGNKDSFCSCSHGAGRVMSRGEARKKITIEQHTEAMKGIEARLDEGTLDESPAAYKDVNTVIAAQSDLIEVVHTLRQIINVKG